MNPDLNDEFLAACEIGDIARVKYLYNIFYPQSKNFFEKFTNIFSFKNPY